MLCAMESSENSSKFLSLAEGEGVFQQDRVRETVGWRPLRRSLLDRAVQARTRSGRFLGVIGLEFATAITGDEEEQFSLAQVLGIETRLKYIFRDHGIASCPCCGESCRAINFEEARSRWSGIKTGVILVGIEISNDTVRSGSEIAEIADFWGGQRVTDGDRLWTLEDLVNAPIAPPQQWFVILDSTHAPLTPAFELSMHALVERTGGVSENRLLLFHCPTDSSAISVVAEIGNGWRCEKCKRSYRAIDIIRRRIGRFDSDRIFDGSFSELEELVSVLPSHETALADAVRVMSTVALDHLPLGFPAAHLSFAEKNLVQLARAFVGGIRDTPFILDSASDIMNGNQQNALLGLRGLFTDRNNPLLDLSATSDESKEKVGDNRAVDDRSVEGFSQMLMRQCDEPGVRIFKPQQFSVVDSPKLFSQLVRRVHDRETANASSRAVVGVSITELREPYHASFGAMIGLREIFEDLIAQTPTAYRNGRLCLHCLGSGFRELKNGSQYCACLSERSSRDHVQDSIVLGRPVSIWAQTPLIDLAPLIQGYPRMTRLVEGLNAIGLGEKAATFSIEEFSDLQRQAIRYLTCIAGSEMDLYKKTKNRRQGKSRLVMFLRPFWGISDQLVGVLREQSERLILPDDTVAYLDSRA